MTYDGLVDIATGKSRRETRWQNKELLWSALIEKLSKTHRTHETYKEYCSAKKDKQDNTKDIGGFVGGHISGGRRKNGSVISRSVLTLDIDFADLDFWANFQIIMTHAACLYSTHKHSKESPRYRLVMPLNRPVGAEEYEAIARKIAYWCGIEYFDPTTFQPARLMYWPSSSSDGEYVFEQVDAPWLCTDTVLATYGEWQDTTQWPRPAGEADEVRSGIKTAGNPLEKTGLIGALCRAYTINDIITKYLSDVYVASLDADRWTYALGSTANGLVVYEDRFAYSHHSTDPVSGKLCNAWDLVRLHKFGALDDRTKEDTKVTDLPSFRAMADLASGDSLVKRQVGEESLTSAKEVFEVANGVDWMEQMELDRNGNYVSTINNIVLILENDPGLAGCFAYNEFTNREVMLKDLPWRKRNNKWDHLVDSDDSALRHYLEYAYGISGLLKISDGLSIVIKKNHFHPVQEYLDMLEWDGIERLDTLFIDYLGGEDNDFVRAVTRKTFIAAVARVFEPGIKFDTCPVLIGVEGLGKSTLISKMGRKWYSDSFMGVQGVLALEQLQGTWIMEIAELNGFKKAETESIKHFISKQVDEFRVAYGKKKDIFPRQNIFIATTNEENFLKDYTGNRRFWPVVTGTGRLNVFTELTGKVVDQVWAEATAGYLAGENLYLDKTTEALAKEIQAEHMETDERIGMIENYLNKLVPEDWKEKSIYERRAWLQADKDDMTEAGTLIRKQVSRAEIYCELLNGSMKDLTSYVGRDISNIMSRIKGWKKTKKMISQKLYGRQYVYERQGDMN